MNWLTRKLLKKRTKKALDELTTHANDLKNKKEPKEIIKGRKNMIKCILESQKILKQEGMDLTDDNNETLTKEKLEELTTNDIIEVFTMITEELKKHI